MLRPDKLMLHVIPVHRAAVAAHAHEDSKCCKLGEQVRASIAHKRQWNTGDGHKPQVHADIDQDMTHKKYRNPKSEKNFKIRASKRRCIQYTPKHERVKYKEEKRTDKSPLFCIGRKYKVSLGFRKKLESGLRAKAEPFAECL